MKVFIFGAGASAGSQKINVGGTAVDTPVTNDLFNDIFIKWVPINVLGLSQDEIVEIRNATSGQTGGLEACLTQRWQKMQTTQDDRLKGADAKFFGKITFYLHNLLLLCSQQYQQDVNLYRKLLHILKVREQKFALVNFNYDTFLDKALTQEWDADLESFDGYIQADYIKPHGSINWRFPKREGIHEDPNPHNGVEAHNDMATRRMFSQPLPDISRLIVRSPFDGNTGIFDYSGRYPAILIPLTEKLYKEFPGFKDKMISRGTKLVKQADAIYLVGYRAADKIFDDLCEDLRPNTKLYIVDRELNSAETIMKNVLRKHPNFVAGNAIKKGIYTGGFADFVQQFEKEFVVSAQL